jgi:hypothetical protein
MCLKIDDSDDSDDSDDVVKFVGGQISINAGVMM